MNERLVFLHSPLVGPSTWQAVAHEMRRRNIHAAAPSLAGIFGAPGPYFDAIAMSVVEQIPFDGPVVLVAHSGAGQLIPAITDTCFASSIPVHGAIFVDALMPAPGRDWFSTVSEERASQLLDLAENGRLPPWHTWFPPAIIESLLPDPGMRAAFVVEIPQIPLDYLGEEAPEAANWPLEHMAYIRLSAGYQAELGTARLNGWRTFEADLHHLAMLTNPGEVADLIEEALEMLIPEELRCIVL